VGSASIRDIKNKLNLGKQETESRNRVLFFFNPMLHTSMLYWASYFGMEESLILEIMRETEAYPEGFVKIH
jgi:hypothetical protein